MLASPGWRPLCACLCGTAVTPNVPAGGVHRAGFLFCRFDVQAGHASAPCRHTEAPVSPLRKGQDGRESGRGSSRASTAPDGDRQLVVERQVSRQPSGVSAGDASPQRRLHAPMLVGPSPSKLALLTSSPTSRVMTGATLPNESGVARTPGSPPPILGLTHFILALNHQRGAVCVFHVLCQEARGAARVCACDVV
jgi:hypothetical protein